MKITQIFFLGFVILLISWCWGNTDYIAPATNNIAVSNTYNKTENNFSKYIYIKHRWYLDIDSSRFIWWYVADNTVRELYYDSKNRYMIINLDGTYYHYCKVPRDSRNWIYNSSNIYNYYENNFYHNFDCRKWWIPLY